MKGVFSQPRAARAVSLALALLLVPERLRAEGDGMPLRVAGSILNETGYIGFRDGIPDGPTRDWFSDTSATARLSRDGDAGRFFASLWSAYSGAEGEWDLSLDEAWFEWRPVPATALRLGRSRIAYGPCVAFNPANSLTEKDSFDSRSNKVGFDGFSAEIMPFSLVNGNDLPYSLVLNAAFILPSEGTDADGTQAGTLFPGNLNDADQGSAHGRLTFYAPGAGILGPTEIGVSGDFKRLGESAPRKNTPVSGGAWLSADVAGFVVGLEGSLASPGFKERAKSRAEPTEAEASDAGRGYGWAVSANRKMGDFIAILEASHTDEGDRSGDDWLGFARLSRSVEDSDVSLSALVNLDTRAVRASLETSWNVTDFLVLHADCGWNYRSEEWDDPLPQDYGAKLALECFY